MMNARRAFLSIASLVGLLIIPPAFAATDQLVVAIRGGTLGNFYVKTLGPMFQKQFGVKVVFTISTSGPALAKVRAEASNPQTDVLWTTAPTQFEGQRRDLFAKIDYGKIPNARDLDPAFVDPNGFFVAKSVEYVGIAFNTQIFRAKGFVAPRSWRDLFNAEYRGRVGIESPADSFGQATIAGLSAVLRGRQDNDAARAIVDRLVQAGPDVLWATSPSHMDQLMTQQDIWIGAVGAARAWQLIDQGAPVEFVIPEEGGFPIPSYWAIVKNSPNPEAAHRWINWHISPEVQALEAREVSRTPANPKAAALLRDNPKVAQRLGHNIRVVVTDWNWVDREFSNWVKRLQLGR